MTTELVSFSVQDHIAAVTLNRAEKRNAMNGPLIQTLLGLLPKIAADERVRVLIISGHGEHFCAGADIAWMQQLASGNEKDNYEDAQLIADLLYQLYMFPKPTLALAHGTTLGGGLGLLAACDMAIAADNASFGFSEVRIGITPSTISPYVIAAIGERAAHYYFLTGERFDAEEARRIGLVHRVCPAQQLPAIGSTLAQTILKNGPKALTAAKQLIRYVASNKISKELAQKSAEHLANLRSTQEAQEGLRAFIEKRAPIWM